MSEKPVGASEFAKSIRLTSACLEAMMEYVDSVARMGGAGLIVGALAFVLVVLHLLGVI